jgi:hypothetical protein
MSAADRLREKPGAKVDLALTLPIFVAYHVGVVFLTSKNATDIVTRPLMLLAEGNRAIYVGITVAIGLAFAAIFALSGRGEAFRPSKFVQIALEGALYATLMQFVAAYVTGRLFAGNIKTLDPFTGVVMSLGAGFYEEIAFRVALFGVGARLVAWLFLAERPPLLGPRPPGSFRYFALSAAWSLAAALLFSSVHYIGAYGDDFQLDSFVFRAVLGLVLTLIYVLRGFAAAVWSHAIYDIWVLVLSHS